MHSSFLPTTVGLSDRVDNQRHQECDYPKYQSAYTGTRRRWRPGAVSAHDEMPKLSHTGLV